MLKSEMLTLSALRWERPLLEKQMEIVNALRETATDDGRTMNLNHRQDGSRADGGAGIEVACDCLELVLELVSSLLEGVAGL